MGATIRTGKTYFVPVERLGLSVLHDLKNPLAGARALERKLKLS